MVRINILNDVLRQLEELRISTLLQKADEVRTRNIRSFTLFAVSLNTLSPQSCALEMLCNLVPDFGSGAVDEVWD